MIQGVAAEWSFSSLSANMLQKDFTKVVILAFKN